MIRLAPLITIYDIETPIDCIGEMTLLFSSNLKGVSNTRQRLNIHVLKPDEIERQSTESSIKSIWIQFDEKSVSKLKEQEKKEAVINLITDSLLKISDEVNWDKQSIIEAKEACKEQNFHFSFTSKPKNKKGNKASVKLSLNNDKIEIHFVLNLKSKKNIEVKVLETYFSHIFFWKYFNKFHWLNENEFGFTFLNNITLTYSLLNHKLKWNFEDNEENREFIKTITTNKFAPFVKQN